MMYPRPVCYLDYSRNNKGLHEGLYGECGDSVDDQTQAEGHTGRHVPFSLQPDAKPQRGFSVCKRKKTEDPLNISAKYGDVFIF